MNKLNGTRQKSDDAMLAFLKIRDGPPSSSIYDPENKTQVFDTNAKHDIMINSWQQVFNKHAGSPSSWDQFVHKYGVHQPQQPPCDFDVPNGTDLHTRAQRATEKANGGSDGWTPSELTN